MEIAKFWGVRTPNPWTDWQKKIGVAITPHVPKFKTIPHWGRGSVCVKYHPRVVFSFHILSYPIFVTPNFARIPRLNHRTDLCGLLYMTSIPSYCIPRQIRIQKLSISPYFYPQNSQKGVNKPQAKCTKYSNFCIIKPTKVIPTKFCTVITWVPRVVSLP